MSTTAQGVFAHCSNGDLALSYTCSGPSCIGIGDFADTTCTGDGTISLSCSNAIVCEGPPLFSSTFYLNQQGNVISQLDYYDFPGYGYFNYTASGSDNETISNLVEETTNSTSTLPTGMSTISGSSLLPTTAKPLPIGVSSSSTSSTTLPTLLSTQSKSSIEISSGSAPSPVPAATRLQSTLPVGVSSTSPASAVFPGTTNSRQTSSKSVSGGPASSISPTTAEQQAKVSAGVSSFSNSSLLPTTVKSQPGSSIGESNTLSSSISPITTGSQQTLSSVVAQNTSQSSRSTTSTGLAGAIASVGGFGPTSTSAASTSVRPGTNATASTAPYIVANISSRQFRLSPRIFLLTVVLLLSSIIPSTLAAIADSNSPNSGPSEMRRAIQVTPEHAIIPRVSTTPSTKALAVRNSHSPSRDLTLHERGYFNSPLPDLIVSIASKLVRNANKIYDLAMTPAACSALSTAPWWLSMIHDSLDAVCLVLSQALTLNSAISNKFTLIPIAAQATKVCIAEVQTFMLRNALWLVFVAELSFGIGAAVEFLAFFFADVMCKLLIDSIFISASAVLDLSCHGYGMLIDTFLNPQDLLPDSCKTLPSSSSTAISSTTSMTLTSSAAASTAAPSAAQTSAFVDCDGDDDPGDPDEDSECASYTPTLTPAPTPTPTAAPSAAPTSAFVDCDGDDDSGDADEPSECPSSSDVGAANSVTAGPPATLSPVSVTIASLLPTSSAAPIGHNTTSSSVTGG
ncbi:hypothetical protein G7Y89_g4732 [Cudoniella acicularis]|uniref:Transmembrane protein n=1 Tax=Cudoniella acicularis TaxID=354080 RepID=A0A8H4RQ65_9HELO|nr:hypothetical protein G7Y89_g4732 [Cudoniella acicularis]